MNSTQVVGAPQLASTGIAQAEAAVDCVYGDGCALGDVSPAGLLASTARYPVGIWTVPELAFCGLTAEAAADRGLDVVVGVAHYADTVRGHVRESDASTRSCLKLVVARDAPHTILGVHLFGDDAAELVHFGTTLVQASMTADDAAVTCYAAVTYRAAPETTSGMDASGKTSNLSLSVESKSFRLIFGRIVFSRRVLFGQ